MKVSVIGTGLMGSPMAEKLLEKGHDVYVYNRTLDKTIPLREKGAKVAVSSFEALQLSEVIITMLADGKAVKDSLFRKDEVQRFTGQTIIQMSTISPKESREIMHQVEELNGHYIEAPVLGSITQVKEGKLIVMVGGNKDDYERCKPLLSAFGPDIMYIGEVGKAAAVKIALNQMIASLTASFSLSLSIIMKENIDVEQFMSILRKSALYAKTFDAKLDNMINNNFSKVNFPAKHLLKDINLALGEAESLDIETAVLKAVREVVKRTFDSGSSDKDYSVMFNEIYKMT
ncbi:MAG: NAD(P)-dependent oxidoreductase [Bacteroidota bacterium]|nr:NAD(P)-dependent oxidoreductase [Bacteroidota bacterium]MDP4197782.1 NAD(P)-dependent oxidoreductase [Bacteroidota bacterium]